MTVPSRPTPPGASSAGPGSTSPPPTWRTSARPRAPARLPRRRGARRRVPRPGRPPELPRHPAGPQVAGARGPPLAGAAGRPDPHLPPPRAPGRRADVLGHPRLPRDAGGVPPRPPGRGPRRDPAHGALRGAARRARLHLRHPPRARLVLGAGPPGETPLGFVATFGMGLEGANLDHTARFAERFRADRRRGRRRRSRSASAPRRCPTSASRSTGSRAGRAASPPAPLAGRPSCPPPLSPLLMRGAPIAPGGADRGRALGRLRRRARAMAARAWLLNLDAEAELANPSARTPSRALAARGRRRWPRALRDLLGPRRPVLSPGVRADGLRGRAWCPTPRALIAAGAEPARSCRRRLRSR